MPHRATRAGTEAYRARRLAEGVAAGHYREAAGLVVSSIGIGTYLGNPDAGADRAYAEAVERAVELGTNFVDSAVNYRFQRSERAVGAALARLFADRRAAREELVIATKGGYIPFDGAAPSGAADQARWVRERILEPGLARPEEVAQGCHCMTPAYLRDQLDLSLGNLGLEAVDVYYLHNPETQLEEIGRDEFRRRLRAAFAELERAHAEGRIGAYGLATWNGLRVEPDKRGYLSLEEAAALAREAAGGGSSRFRFVQLPLNLAMPEALALENQKVGGEAVTLLEAARRLGVAVVASASMLQARLASRLPSSVARAFPGLQSDAQRAIQFARSAPGVSAALVGMGRKAHVEENLALARLEPAPPEAIASLFDKE